MTDNRENREAIIRFSKDLEKQNDRIFFENLTGYSFILMFIFMMFAINPLFVIVPVALYYATESFKYIKNHPVDRRILLDEIDILLGYKPDGYRKGKPYVKIPYIW